MNPFSLDRSSVKVSPDGAVSVKGCVVGWVWLKLKTKCDTEIWNYGFVHGTTLDLGYSRDGAAIACARAYFEARSGH